VVEVGGNPPRYDEVQSVPHGVIEARQYVSTPLKRARKAYVYLPPQYEAERNRRFPVLCLRHGGGDDEQSWSTDGRAGGILLRCGSQPESGFVRSSQSRARDHKLPI